MEFKIQSSWFSPYSVFPKPHLPQQHISVVGTESQSQLSFNQIVLGGGEGQRVHTCTFQKWKIHEAQRKAILYEILSLMQISEMENP